MVELERSIYSDYDDLSDDEASYSSVPREITLPGADDEAFLPPQPLRQFPSHSGSDRALFLEQPVLNASVASGVLGLVLGGPLIGLALGLGVASNGRETAKVARDLTNTVQKAATRWDERCGLSQGGRLIALETWERLRDMEEQQGVLAQASSGIVRCWTDTIQFVRHEATQWMAEVITGPDGGVVLGSTRCN